MGAVRRRHVAHQVGDGANPVKVGGLGILQTLVPLHHDAELTLLAHRLLGGGDRARSAHADRQNHAGKQHRIAYRHDNKRVRRQGRRSCARSVLCL